MTRQSRNKALKQPLYQVFAETKDGTYMAVSPKMIRAAAEQVAIGLKGAIAQGKRDWGNVNIELAQRGVH